MVSCFMLLLIHASLERAGGGGGGGGGASLPSERQVLQSDGVWNNKTRPVFRQGRDWESVLNIAIGFDI